MLMLIVFLFSFGNRAESVLINDDDFLSLLITDYNRMVRPSNCLDRGGALSIFNNYITDIGQICDVKLPPNAQLVLHSATHNAKFTALEHQRDKNSNELIVDAWMPTTWTDTRLSAAAERFRNDFSHISIPQSEVWVPDITLYQRPTTHLDYEPHVLLYGSGRMVYVPSSRIWTDDCNDVGKGITECSFRFGSWSYNTDDVHLKSDGILMYEFRKHPEFEIVKSTAVRLNHKGPCCEGYWACIKYTLSIRRR